MATFSDGSVTRGRKEKGSVITIDTVGGFCQLGTMPRKLRMQYPGAIYHLMNRGDRREDIFQDDEDRQRFLQTLGEACEKTGWQVHAYCLMSNHFHLVIETPQPNLVAGMKWLLGTYTVRFNRRHGEFGHLFSGRYKSLIVDGSGRGYLKSVCDYVHLNPVRAGLLAPKQALESYRWSSYGQYLKGAAKRLKWLRVDRLLGEWGIHKDSPAGRRHFARCLEGRRRQESLKADWRAVERGWFLGDPQLKEELLAQMHERRQDHYGPELRQAERVLREELSRRGWTEAELSRRRKGDPEKVALAGQLRARTTMTLKWI
ncbi:MAG TPA: transposase, partial [Verrucomicrobiae bacterium]|nr:transposase [Verrucomicrobiae bacterium]